LRLVGAAILAANAHNAQAWRFAVSPRRIELYDDPRRSLGTVDGYRREIHLSTGCAVENIALAARAAGFTPTVTLATGSGTTGSGTTGTARAPLATIDLAPAEKDASELYRAIPHRHTDRGAYQSGRALPAHVVTRMNALGDHPDVRLQWLLTPAQMEPFSTLTVAATEAFIADLRQSADDYAWYRSTRAEIQRHRDGVTPDAGGLTPLVRSLSKLIPATATSNSQYWLAGTRDRQLPTASAFAILLVKNAADVEQRLNAGRLYQRASLWATAQGLVMQPLNQIVERAERERLTTGPAEMSRGVTALIDDPAWQMVMPFRIGYPTAPAPASPRRALAEVLVVSS
jgi:hypothetical protein